MFIRSNQLVCEWKIRTEERTLTRSGTTACTGDEALWRGSGDGGGGTQLRLSRSTAYESRPLPARHVVEGEWPQEVAIVSPSWP